MLTPPPIPDDEIQALLKTCGVLYSSGSNFLKEVRADPALRHSKPICLVMTLLMRHQIEALDAAVALTRAGRPQFVDSISRSMYETYLNILGIGWLRATIGRVTYTPAYSARRFLAFRAIVVKRYDSGVEKLSEGWTRLGMDNEEAKKRRRLLLRRVAGAKRRYGFHDKTMSWFHHNGVTGLYESLWKENALPCFPEPLSPAGGDRTVWKTFFATHWGHGSNQVHASIIGLTSRPDDSRDSWPSLEPVSNYTNLGSAHSIATMSLFSVADALRRLPEFNLMYAACENDQSASGRYIP